MSNALTEPSENWDDDFLFTANDPQRHIQHSTSTHDDFLTPSRAMDNLTPHDYAEDTAHSRFSFASSAWDADDTTVAGPSNPKRRTSNEHDTTRPPLNLTKWSEETPSDDLATDDMDFLPAPTRDVARTMTSRRRLKLSTGPPLTSDADFPKDSIKGPSNRSWTTENVNETNYDKDFEDFPTLGARALPEASFAFRPPSVASTRSSSRHGRVRQHMHTRSSSSLHLPSPSVPIMRNAITGSPVPPSIGSPTRSSFSALVSLSSERSRSSMYPLIPPGTSPPRVRRRLRKKSRPHEFDGTIMEMMPPRPLSRDQPRASGSSEGLGLTYMDGHDVFDELDEDRLSNGDPTIIGARAASPAMHRSPSPYDARANGATSPTNATFFRSSSPPASPPPKVPLLSRIGSMKRWRSRRSSTPSQDISLDTSMESIGMNGGIGMSYVPPETPEPGLMRAASPTALASSSSNRSSWLFSRASASPASHANGTAPPSPELKRSNSHSRPQLRFGRKRSTTVGDVLKEEDRGEEGVHIVLDIGKGKVSVEDMPAFLSSASHSNSSTPPISGTKPKSRRPLSLQPQKRPSGSGPPSNASSWLGSVGRSTSNPFVASAQKSKSKEDIASSDTSATEDRDRISGVLKKRVPSSGSRRSPHRRSISLTSDPDDIVLASGRRSPTPLGIVPQGSPPPPVPPLPSRHQSQVASSSLTLLPPIALSPPSPPNTSRGSSAVTSPLLLQAPSAPSESPGAPASSHRVHQLHRQHSSSISQSSSTSPTTLSPRGVALLSVAPSSPTSGQTLSLGRGSQVLASQFLAAADSGDARSITPSSNSGPSTSSSVLTVNASGSNGTLRRSSLGDLKIPARISMAQTGLRNNLGMLREFATKVDDIQKLQLARTNILSEIFGNPRTTNSSSSASLTPSPLVPDLKTKPSVERLEQQYALWWECAELLVELGGSGASGSSSMKGTPPPPKEKILSPSTISVPMDEDPTVTLATREKEKDDHTITLSLMTPIRPRERQRSITLVGHEKTPPDVTNVFSPQQTIRQNSTAPSPTSSTTDSRGRNDLSMRQLALLKEMLETPDPTAFDRHHSNGIRFASQPESQRPIANGYGHPTASAITLPSIPSSPRPSPAAGSSPSVSEVSSNMHITQGHANGNKMNGSGKSTAGKGKRMQRLRDMLRSLTNTSNNRDLSNLSSASEVDVSRKQRKRKSTDPVIVTGSRSENLVPLPPPASVKHANSPYGIASLGDRGHRSSPRRPSLASIFRIGQSQASTGSTPITPLGSNLQRMRLRRKPSTPAKDSRISITEDRDDDDYSDWDRMDSASDLEGGMSPTPRRAQSPRHHEQATIKGRRARTPSVDQQRPPPVPPLRLDQTPTPVPRSNPSQISLRSSPSKPRLGGRVRSRTTDTPVPPPPSIGLTRPSVSSSGVNTSATNSAVPSPSPADFKLALTPENIRPLLEYAKEVSARLNDCISELRDVQARSDPVCA